MNEFCPIFKVFKAFNLSNLNMSTEPKHSFPISNDSKDSKFERLNDVEFEKDPSPTEMVMSLASSNSYSYIEHFTSDIKRATIEIQRRFINGTNPDRF